MSQDSNLVSAESINLAVSSALSEIEKANDLDELKSIRLN
jgi:hypothetical protein